MTKKLHCACYGFVCHTGPEAPFTPVVLKSKGGGPDWVSYLSKECLGRMKGLYTLVEGGVT